MEMNDICENCTKAIHEHTQNELISCKLELEKQKEADASDDEITDDFNAIKSGEFSRMSEGQGKSKKT